MFSIAFDLTSELEDQAAPSVLLSNCATEPGGRVEGSALTARRAAAMLFDVIHAGSQTRMAMMPALITGAAAPLVVRV